LTQQPRGKINSGEPSTNMKVIRLITPTMKEIHFYFAVVFSVFRVRVFII